MALYNCNKNVCKILLVLVPDDDDDKLCIMPIQYGDREQAWDVTDSMLVNRLTGKVSRELLEIMGSSLHIQI